MKKILILLWSILPLVTFTACTSEDDIRKDIDDLNARLDALQTEFDKLNENISTFYDLAAGKIYFTSCTPDERGNYTLQLSDGTSWKVYGGMPEGEIPTVTINEDGHWVFAYDGEETDLGKATPEDGKNGTTPQMSVDEEGYWCYQLGDGEKQRVPGPYNVAEIAAINPSIFESVTVSGENPNVMQFKLYGMEEPVEIALLGGLDMTFSFGPVTIAQGGSQTLKATLTEVKNVVISPTPLQVSLTEVGSNNLTVEAPATVEAGDYTVYFEIYNTAGYRLVKSLKVTVTE